MTADLDTLLIALYVELTDRIIPGRGFTRSGPGQRPVVTDAELVCIAVAQVLLRFDDERRWLRAAAASVRAITTKAGSVLASTAAFSTEAAIGPGSITIAQVAQLYPYDNTLRAVRLTNADEPGQPFAAYRADP